MKIAIIGATGKAGKLIMEEALIKRIRCHGYSEKQIKTF